MIFFCSVTIKISGNLSHWSMVCEAVRVPTHRPQPFIFGFRINHLFFPLVCGSSQPHTTLSSSQPSGRAEANTSKSKALDGSASGRQRRFWKPGTFGEDGRRSWWTVPGRWQGLDVGERRQSSGTRGKEEVQSWGSSLHVVERWSHEGGGTGAEQITGG